MTIALIGYGEVGRILAEDLRAQGQAVAAFDLKLGAHEAAARPLRDHAAAHGVVLAASHAQAVRSVELVLSAVTASQAVAAGLASNRASWVGTRESSTGRPRGRGQASGRSSGRRSSDGASQRSSPPQRRARTSGSRPLT